jgi:hypothetical protein
MIISCLTEKFFSRLYQHKSHENQTLQNRFPDKPNIAAANNCYFHNLIPFCQEYISKILQRDSSPEITSVPGLPDQEPQQTCQQQASGTTVITFSSSEIRFLRNKDHNASVNCIPPAPFLKIQIIEDLGSKI